MAGQSVGAVFVDAVINNKGFNKQIGNTVKGAENSFGKAFAKIGAAIGAALSVAAVTNYAKSCVQAAATAESAFMGLNSILTANGKSFQEANKFLKEYTADGLVGMTSAVTAYKNLAARGYNTEQIESVMYALKDAAAFGRAAAYSYEDAITSATEGLRQENSILVDNAGVTKNVAKMWEEYAASIGKTSNNLTQQEKIQAEVNGILAETKAQLGDAALYANTFQGRMSQLKSTFGSIKTEIGNIIIPIANLFIPYIQAAANAVLNFVTRIKQLLAVFGLKMQEIGGGSDGIASSMDAATSSAGAAADAIEGTGTAATKAAKAVKRALAPYDELNKLSTSTDSGSGGGSGGSAGGIGGDVALEATKSPVSEAVESVGASLEKFLAPLKDINFDNLIWAFGLLWESIKNLGGTVWDGLKWAYENILVPLAEWTIEDLLPAFLYALSGALDAVNGILIEVAPAFEWLFDKFLSPLAAWTGDLVVDSLYALGDALKWVGDNADLVVAAAAGLAAAFGTFKGLQIAASVIEFIKYAATLAGATTVWGAITAAFAQLWTYVTASGVWASFTAAWQGLTGALAAVAAALGISVGWLLAIIAAVAALVAGIVLLIKHWDEVVAWLKALPDKIVAAWESMIDWWRNLPNTIRETFDKAADWIDSIDWKAIGYNIAKSIGDGIVNVAEWLDNAWKAIKQWFADLPAKLETAWQATVKWIENLPETITAFFDELDEYMVEVALAMVDGLIRGWESISTAVEDFVDGFVQGIKDALGIHSPSKVFEEIALMCIKGLVNGLTGAKTSITKAWSTVKGWFSDIKKSASVTVSQKWADIKSKWESLTKNVKSKTVDMKAKVATTWSNIKSKWESVTKNIKDKTASMKAKVGTTWSSIKGTWNNLLANFKDKTVTVSLKLESLVSDMKSWLNTNVIEKINNALPIVNIPYLAQGGWLPANSPQLAVVGDNRREGEIVAPESKIRDQVKAAMAELGMGGGTAVVRLEIAMPDGRKIIKEINRAQMQEGKVLLLT